MNDNTLQAMKFKLLGCISIVCLLFLSLQLQAQNDTAIQIRLSKDNTHELTLSEKKNGEYQVETTGSDPYLFTEKLSQPLSDDQFMLSFDYFCPTWLDHLQIYFGDPIDEDHSLHTELGVAEGWTTFSIDVKTFLKEWGKSGDYLRFDFGSVPDYKMQIRNIRFRKPTERELETAKNREKNALKDLQITKNLETYLNKEYADSITHIAVSKDKIVIQGKLGTMDHNLFLSEITLDQNITEVTSFPATQKINDKNNKTFTLNIDRYVNRNGGVYDRLFSKWAIISSEGNKTVLRSHARYADEVVPLYDLPDEKPWNKKGLGGFGGGALNVSDLDSLNISSVTINIWITQFIHSAPSAQTMPYDFNGKTYYIDKDKVANLDKTLAHTTKRNIITSAIILVGKASSVKDKAIGKIFEHPDCDPAGIYSMANLTTAEGVEYYTAIVDFLAQRYSRPDKRYGRIHHWIIHNEVDAGWVWTNMGEKPPLLFMDHYIKSMRAVYLIARKYNAHAKVFISLTHYWTWTADRHFYHPKELLEILLRYSKQEGDFDWAIAQHPYPESLFEPKSWLDKKVDFTFNTPLITYKNIEVLNAWVEQPDTYYLGKYKRVIHLSEQGTNSMDYTEKSLMEQAAGMAYAWKKIKNLKNIEAFQYHNWMDNRGEGGLRIGLRRFHDDVDDPSGKKPIWYVFRDMGTDKEDNAFEFAKDIIGIDSWEEILYKGEITATNDKNDHRDLKSDTWVATDALGRKLPGFEEVGPLKKDRYVGMFYFITHNQPGKGAIADVTKIKAANPEDPQWGAGTHYWGEPEDGYYVSSDEWVIRKHANLLSDAGVDVIIFDCTNNQVYAKVTDKIFEVFRKMRAEGEQTPAIAFLASEASVLQLWDQLYSKGRYADLWFQWKGKPLLMFGQWAGIKPMNEVVFPSEIKQFFTIRNSWAWTTLPWYKDEGKGMWPWVDHYPQHVGWYEAKDKPEYIPVAAAEHPLSNIGRSFHEGIQPETDKYDLTPFTSQGLFFAEQWKRALEVDPEFVFVTGWNEWTAGKMVMGKDIEKALKSWDFFPGAKLGKAGKPVKEGDTYFIDQYNQEYSRDIEPMKDGHSDNYYYQLMANIRRYKGVREPIAPSPSSLQMNGSADQWKDIRTAYYDHVNDVVHRKSPGNFDAGPYINNAGRNDIIETRVSHNEKNFFFYIESAETLSPYTDKNWMLVFLDVDQNKNTGWEGYDYVINSKVKNDSTTTLYRFTKKAKLKKVSDLALKISDCGLAIVLPKNVLKEDLTQGFDFHIVDNIPHFGDIRDFFHAGDNAPSRRANYRYGIQ